MPSDLIYREDAKDYARHAFAKGLNVLEYLNEVPAANFRPVVRGKWNRTDAYPHRLYCSVCYKTYLKNDELLGRWKFPLNFCPNCGADMREEGK